MKKRQEWTLKKKLQRTIMGIVMPLVFCILALLLIMAYYAVRYQKITSNIDVSSKFNLDFKNDIDLKMYHYAVWSKEQKQIPVGEVEEAITLFKELEENTERKESQRAIRNLIKYCENLQEKMYIIEGTDDYDSRQIQLENNIYVLTGLIQEEMMRYIYYEAGYLGMVERNMFRSIIGIIIIAAVLVVVAVSLIVYQSVYVSNQITNPIRRLCENVNQVGQGNFQIPSANASTYEIVHLDKGIQQMAEQICVLLENVKKEEKEQHKIQLQLLQEQINPHFLYNTLDTIIWLVESDKGNEATEMLSNLSVFFRTSLSKGANIIPLREEMRHTRSYLEIQQVRYQDILDYEIDLPKEMEEIRLPKLTLQPLVENALYHGVKEKRGKSRISIYCEKRGEDICIVIADNGIGIKEEALQQIRDSLQTKEDFGFGMRAVQGRLKLYFGESYGIHIASVYGEGTTVEVLVPNKC